MTMTKTSVFDSQRKVELDPYGPNPLAEDMAGSPAYLMAIKHSPPPKLFSGGAADLPAFTASGLDPKMLMQLPYTMRHAAAAEPDMAMVHSIFEQYGHLPDYTMEHAGLTDAFDRMRDWAINAGADPIKEASDERARQADAQRAADLASLPPDRRAGIAAATAQIQR